VSYREGVCVLGTQPTPSFANEGFFARKKREKAEKQVRKAKAKAKELEELANARAGTFLMDYLEPTFDTAIAVRKGAAVSVLSTDNDQWWKVSAGKGSEAKVGFVPASMVELAPEPAAEPEPTVHPNPVEKTELAVGIGEIPPL
jgi:hypothetical protein